MAIQVTLLKNPGFTQILTAAERSLRDGETKQTQQFQNFQLQNGYGTATKVSVSPGFGAKVTAHVAITVHSVTEQTFKQIIHEVKKSSSYQNNSQFQQYMASASYSSAGSYASGIFGWLCGGGSSSYSNQSSNLTNEINQYNSGNSSDDITVANTVANIIVKNTSNVTVSGDINVIGQLLVPSPTVIAVETTTFTFTDESGNTSSVTMLNQSPLVPVDVNSGTVSANTLEPGSKLTIVPSIG